jgi:hypothetical protein
VAILIFPYLAWIKHAWTIILPAEISRNYQASYLRPYLRREQNVAARAHAWLMSVGLQETL